MDRAVCNDNDYDEYLVMKIIMKMMNNENEIDNGQGSTCEDVGTVLCCGHLANCQLAQEIQERGDKK